MAMSRACLLWLCLEHACYGYVYTNSARAHAAAELYLLWLHLVEHDAAPKPSAPPLARTLTLTLSPGEHDAAAKPSAGWFALHRHACYLRPRNEGPL